MLIISILACNWRTTQKTKPVQGVTQIQARTKQWKNTCLHWLLQNTHVLVYAWTVIKSYEFRCHSCLYWHSLHFYHRLSEHVRLCPDNVWSSQHVSLSSTTYNTCTYMIQGLAYFQCSIKTLFSLGGTLVSHCLLFVHGDHETQQWCRGYW